MATVAYKQATRIYPKSTSPAVDKLDLQISDGEFLVLVGPSGCGKSTSLRMLAGLEMVDEGAVFIDDQDVTDLPPKSRDIAMVFQNYALYPHMSVAENMGFALKIAGVNKAEIRQRVGEAAKLLDLAEYLDRRPKQLSGGQRQRVAMGRAIVRKPHVFLMDEPLSNLDAKLRASTRTQIAALQRRGRSEALDIAEPGHGLTVVVDMVEELGSDALLYAGLASHTEQAITQGHDLVARVDVRYAPAKGEPVTLRIREDALHLFDTATGLRIQP